MRVLTLVTLASAALPIDAQFGGMPPKQRSNAVKGELCPERLRRERAFLHYPYNVRL